MFLGLLLIICYDDLDGNDIHFGASLNGKNYVVENRLNIQAQNLKRRSWDLSHTMDNSLQLSLVSNYTSIL